MKKISVISAMSLILGLGTCVSAFANDGVEIGTANLNGTPENSAKIGDTLPHPEIGWERYDDTDKNIQYSSSFLYASGLGTVAYNSTGHYVVVSDRLNPQYMKFNFYGTKLRFIGKFASLYTQYSRISFDGGKNFESLSEYSSPINATGLKTVIYSKTGLEKTVHNVVIEVPNKVNPNGGASFWADAIDIDQDGYLAPYSDPIKAESISLNKSSLDLSVGNSEQLTATTTPSAVGVTWKSSDESVATVDSNGKVTGIKEGQAIVTATTADGSNLSSSCTVNVKDVSPTVVSLSVTPEEAKLMPGGQKQLQVTATMSDGSTKDVTDGSNGTTYTSSRPTIGTVDENGLVTIFQDAPLDHVTCIYVTYGGITVSSEIWTGTDATN